MRRNFFVVFHQSAEFGIHLRLESCALITYHACVMCNSPPSSFCEVGDGGNCRLCSSLAPSIVELAVDGALALLAAAGLVEKPKARIRSP